MMTILFLPLGFIAAMIVWDLYTAAQRKREYMKMKQEAARLENERRERLTSWAHERFEKAELNGIPAHIVAKRVLVNGWEKQRAANTPVNGADQK